MKLSGRTRRYVLAAVWPCLLWCVCLARKTPLEPVEPGRTGDFVLDEAAVYTVLLTDVALYPSDTLAIADSTVNWNLSRHTDYLLEEMPSLQNRTMANFLEANRGRFPLRDLIVGGKTVLLFGRSELWDWEKNAPNAHGAVSLSRVGFNATGTQALVYHSIYWAPLAAEGNVTLLEKRRDAWHIVKTLMIWIS
jgi:hypothetical protein